MFRYFPPQSKHCISIVAARFRHSNVNSFKSITANNCFRDKLTANLPNLSTYIRTVTSKPVTPSDAASGNDRIDEEGENKPNQESKRPFSILGLQQIALGSLERSPLKDLWMDTFGLPKIGQYKSEKENVDEDILQLGAKGSPFAVEVDLMIPLDPEKRPKVHVPALNHIGLWVDDLEQAVQWMTKRGVRFTPGGIRKGAAGHNVTFIHPKGNDEAPVGGAGSLIELVQAPPEVIKAFKDEGE